MGVPWKDSNLALIGSDLDHKIKAAAAAQEEAWQGMGQTAPETRVWRIEKFQVKEWPSALHGKFHKGDSYIVLHTYKEGTSESLLHNIHIWIGSESSQDEYGTAAYKMVEADEYLGGVPVQHREVEGHESAKFRSYFDALEYLDGGIESGFNHVEPTVEHPFLFHVKGTHKKLSLTQVPLRKTSLNSGDSFILFGDKSKVWCWHGASARGIEKAKCNMWAENMCTLGTVSVLDQGQGDEESGDFWSHLEDDGEIGPDKEDDEGVQEFSPVLYRIDSDPTKPLEQVVVGQPIQKTSRVVPSLNKSSLQDDDVFLMDSGWEIFIWIGSGADKGERLAAMGAADRFTAMEPRSLELPVVILKAGQETRSFNAYFE